MNTNKYIADSMKEALQKVKDDLGEDAIIISNRRLKQGKIEIIAQSDTQLNTQSYDSSKNSVQPTTSSLHNNNSANVRDMPSTAKNGLDLTDEQAEMIIKSFSQSGMASGTSTTNKTGLTVQKKKNTIPSKPELHQSNHKFQDKIALTKDFGSAIPSGRGAIEPLKLKPNENLLFKALGEEIKGIKEEMALMKSSFANKRIGSEGAERSQASTLVVPEAPLENRQSSEVSIVQGVSSPAQVSSDISELKKMLQEFMAVAGTNASTADKLNLIPPKKSDDLSMQQLFGEFNKLGFSRQFTDEAIQYFNSSFPTDARTQQSIHQLASHQVWEISAHFLKKDSYLPGPNVIEEPGYYVFLGPTGAGKTTSLAKIAAKYILQKDARRIAILSMDTFRVGAKEQINMLGQILKVPIEVIETNHDLLRFMRKRDQFDLILIDTSGFTFRNAARNKNLRDTIANVSDLKPLLVLPSTHQMNVQTQSIKCFQDLKIHSAILTKCDEALSIGGSIESLVNHQIGLSFICNGQNIPDDIHTYDLGMLLNIMKGLYRSNESMGHAESNLSCDRVLA